MTLVDRFSFVLSPQKRLRRAAALIEEGKSEEAFPHLAAAAKAGIPEACYRIGRAYLGGAGVPVSRTEGARWIERAASSGWVEAQSNLATLYLYGMAGTVDGHPNDNLFAARKSEEKLEPNYDAALHWSLKAAENGSPEGQALVGYVLTSGPDRLRDLEAGDAWYERAAESGSPQGHLGVALAIMRKATSPEESERGAKSLQRAADAGLPTALYLLGVMRERGAGVERDPQAAIALYRRAADAGVRSAQARLGLALIEGNGTTRNPTEGESWLRRAALGGDIEAAALVGDLYSRGGDLPPNYAEASIWYSRAAEAGHAAAARARGLRLLPGAGGQRAPEAPAGSDAPPRVATARPPSTSPISSCRATARRRTGSRPGPASSRRPRRAIWWPPSISASASPKASASTATNARPSSGCVARRTAWSTPSTGMAACWSKAAASMPISAKAPAGSHAPPIAA